MRECPLTEAPERLGEIVKGLEEDSTPVVLTEGGRPVAAVVTIRDYEWLEEMEDRWLSRLAAEALEEHRKDPSRARTAEEVFRELREEDERPTDAAR